MAAAVKIATSKKWHAHHSELGIGPLSIEPYISRAYFEKERERIFSKVWLNVGRVEQTWRQASLVSRSPARLRKTCYLRYSSRTLV